MDGQSKRGIPLRAQGAAGHRIFEPLRTDQSDSRAWQLRDTRTV